jgi:diacylglycerol kinase family enzyme
MVEPSPFHPDHSLVIVNPSSGRPYLRARRSALLKELRLMGYRIVPTKERRHATDLARRAEEEGKRGIVVVGGDGTLLEVIHGISSQMAIAPFPSGTINLLALALGVPATPRAWLRILRQGILRSIYSGMVGEVPFMSVASVGFDAQVVAELDKRVHWKRRLQEGAFAFVALKEFLNYTPPRIEVYLDGERFAESVLGVLVGKVPYFAGSRLIFPTISPFDPELEVILLAGDRKFSLVRYTYGLLTGRLAGMEGVYVRRVREVEVFSDPPCPVEVDGEPYGNTPVRFTVSPSNYSFLSPR